MFSTTNGKTPKLTEAAAQVKLEDLVGSSPYGKKVGPDVGTRATASAGLIVLLPRMEETVVEENQSIC